jgi:MoaA/NifB/PqqE/SkfB family radical SAM enzyme
VPGSHGWAEVSRERKREIIEAIVSGKPTKGPVHAEIDLTDRCNVACYFCNQQDVRTKEQISIEHLRSLVDELAEAGLKSVRISGGGDPLFHRNILEFLDHLHARGVVVDNLTTNGALLNPEVARRLIDYEAREVVISLNAVDEADYHRMMQVPAGIFHKVLANVRHLVESRSESRHPDVVVQFLLDRSNYERLPEMYELGRSLGADRISIGLVLFVPTPQVDHTGLLADDAETAEKVRPFLGEVLHRDKEARRIQMELPFQAWNAMVEEIKRQLGYAPSAPLFPIAPSFRKENGHCFFGWYTATIRGNGDLYPCCLLMNKDYKPMGDATNGRFADHWNGPEFTQLRREMREVLLEGDDAVYDRRRYRVIQPQCVKDGLCWLKNMYFRADEEFYRELGEALAKARAKERFAVFSRRAIRRGRAWGGRIVRRSPMAARLVRALGL